MERLERLFLTLLSLIQLGRAQVPGAVYTSSGYDNAGGEEAICWSAPAFHNHTAVDEALGIEHDDDEEHEEDEDHGEHDELEIEDFDGINWHSDLVPDFLAGPTTMLASCPAGTNVHVDIIPEKVHGSYRMRTNRLYVYHVVGEVDLGAIREQYDLDDNSFFYSSDGLHDIGLRIEFCPVNGNLCSPFVLERLESETLGGHIHEEGDVHDGDSHDGHSDHDEDQDSHDEEGETHDDDHDEEDDHGHEHRRIRKRRRRLNAKLRATQVVAFNLTFEEEEEEDGNDPDHDEDHLEEDDHDDAEMDHDDEHEGEGDADHDDEHEGEGDADHDDEHHSDDEDDEHSINHEGHGSEAHDSHDHDEDHAGHDIEVEEQRVKHLSSRLFLIPVNITNETLFEFHLDIDVEVTVPGNYLPLASLQFFMSNETIHGHAVGIDSEAALKFDVANLLHQRAVVYYEQPTIQTVDLAIEILSYVIIGVAGLVQLFCLCATFHYRKDSVMKLSQGSFLMLLQGAGIVATVCSFLYNPKSDAYCILSSPMTLIPLQFMFAVVFGRLRRIIRIMEPLMNWNSPQSSRNVKHGLKAWKQSFMMRKSSGSFSSSRDGSTSRNSKGSKASSHSSTNGDDKQEEEVPRQRIAPSWKPKMFCRNTNVRQQFTAGRLWLVVAVLTLPIIVVEIVGLALFLPELTLDMNSDQSIGRMECGTEREQKYHLSSTAVLLLTLFLCLFEAQRSRKLPGLFNEAESVSFALLSSLFVGALGFAVIIVSGEPAADPNAPYIMEVIIVSYMATVLVVRLTLPKLRLIWKGEKVVIAKMVSDHRKSQQKSSSKGETAIDVNGVSGLSDSFRPSSSSMRNSLEQLGSGKSIEDRLENGTANRDSVGSETDLDATSPRSISETDKSVRFDESTNKRASESSIGSPKEQTRHHHTNDPLIIRLGQDPPDRLMFRVLKHSNVMSRVNERILSGLQVDREGWEAVKASMDELHGLLDNVEFR